MCYAHVFTTYPSSQENKKKYKTYRVGTVGYIPNKDSIEKESIELISK